MPPPKEKLQPSDAERRQVIAWLTAQIEQYHREQKPARRQTVLRRLNAREYRNTIRDLLASEHARCSIRPLGFPRDQTTEHLDNVGESLVTSGHSAAALSGRRRSRHREGAASPPTKPAVQTWKFSGGFRQQPEIDQVHGRTNGFSRITLYDVIGADKPEGAYGPIWGFKEGVPFDGYYEIRFKAEAAQSPASLRPRICRHRPRRAAAAGHRGGQHRAPGRCTSRSRSSRSWPSWTWPTSRGGTRSASGWTPASRRGSRSATA